MTRIILQPSGNQGARIHFRDTVENPVSLNKIQPFVDTETYKDLQNIYPSGHCYAWGVTPGGSNATKWNRIERGDVTLFSGNGIIFSSGVTTYKLHNRELAEQLWQLNNAGETWEYIYFLDQIRNLSVRYSDFNQVVGYSENYIIQGFNVLTNEQSRPVLDTFNLESDLFLPDVDVSSYLDTLNELDKLDETEKSILTKQRLEQAYLKKVLFGNLTNGTCACCSKVYPTSYLVTAHIKKRSHCTAQEKKDHKVVMPMCKFGCDEIFEKGYITVENGKFISQNKSPNTSSLNEYINSVVGKTCNYWTVETEKYFHWHRQHHH
jgi:hypothetical protein